MSRVVNAGAGGVEIAFDAAVFRGHAEVRVDQHAEHAETAVIFDEPHAAHVGSQVVNSLRVLERFVAGVLLLQVELEILRLGESLIPLAEWLDIDGADIFVSLGGADRSPGDRR